VRSAGRSEEGEGCVSVQSVVAEIFGSDLRPPARLLALELAHLSGAQRLPIDRMASVRVLAAHTGFTRRVVLTHLPELMRRGFVARAAVVLEDHSPRTDKGVTLPAELREFVFERDNWSCLRCQSVSDLTVDHIRPRALGGTDDLPNLQTLCRSCNSSKGARV
jgi:hypothetical protein